MVFVLAAEHWTSSILLQGYWKGAWEFAQPVDMCFVDLEKAYDCVSHGFLWGVILEYGVHGLLLRAIQFFVLSKSELGSHCWQ